MYQNWQESLGKCCGLSQPRLKLISNNMTETWVHESPGKNSIRRASFLRDSKFSRCVRFQATYKIPYVLDTMNPGACSEHFYCIKINMKLLLKVVGCLNWGWNHFSSIWQKIQSVRSHCKNLFSKLIGCLHTGLNHYPTIWQKLGSVRAHCRYSICRVIYLR